MSWLSLRIVVLCVTVLSTMVVEVGGPSLTAAQEYPCPPDSAQIAEIRRTANEIRAMAREPAIGLTSQAAYIAEAASWDAWADDWIAYCARQPEPSPTPRAPAPRSAAQPPASGSGGQSQGSAPSGGGFPSAAGGGQYQSQGYGFSLSWGPEWSLISQRGAGTGFEGISLQNGTSQVIMAGIATSDTPQVTVEALAQGLDMGLAFQSVVTDEPAQAGAFYATPDGV